MRIGIFGAGQAGKMCLEWIPHGNKVICFIDNDEEKQGNTVNGIRVICFREAMREQLDCILIAAVNKRFTEEISNQIQKSNFQGIVVNLIDIKELQDNRLAALRLVSHEILERKISGDVAELGVYRGEFAAEINRCFPDRKLHLFDTFSGFDKRDLIDEKENDSSFRKLSIHRFEDTNQSIVYRNLPFPEKAVFHTGYFPDSTEGKRWGKFAFVSLDPDLYLPVKNGLQFFYPKMNSGGIILIHDYNSEQFPGVKKAVREFCEVNEAFVFPLTDIHGSAVLIHP